MNRRTDGRVGTLLKLAATILAAGALVAALLFPWVGGPAVAAQRSTGLLGDLPTELTIDTPPANTVLLDRKSTRLNSSHANISYAVFCLKKNRIPTQGT